MGSDMAIDKNGVGTLLSSDTAQFYTTDLNRTATTIPGFTSTWSFNSSANTVATQFDAIPNPALTTTGCPTAPVDGFYSVAPYRGAFSSSGSVFARNANSIFQSRLSVSFWTNGFGLNSLSCALPVGLPGINSHASSAVKARIGASIWHRPVTSRCSAVCVERRRGEFAASV